MSSKLNITDDIFPDTTPHQLHFSVNNFLHTLVNWDRLFFRCYNWSLYGNTHDIEDFLGYDDGKYHCADDNKHIHPASPLWPNCIRAWKLNDYEKADKAQDKEIFIAQAIEKEKQRQDEAYPSAECIYDLLAFRQHVFFTLSLIVYMLIALVFSYFLWDYCCLIDGG